MTQSHSPQPPWREIYQDGSEQAEQDHFRELADRIVGVQRENERKSGSHAARRTFHAKIVVGVDNAELAFPADHSLRAVGRGLHPRREAPGYGAAV